MHCAKGGEDGERCLLKRGLVAYGEWSSHLRLRRKRQGVYDVLKLEWVTERMLVLVTLCMLSLVPKVALAALKRFQRFCGRGEPMQCRTPLSRAERLMIEVLKGQGRAEAALSILAGT